MVEAHKHSIMKDVELKLPDKLWDFMQNLVDGLEFESIEAFMLHASYWVAELYGFSAKAGGKNLSALIVELITSKVDAGKKEDQKVQTVVQTVVKSVEIPNKDLIMETYGSSKFMFEDAIFAACQFTALKQGKPPLSKEEFYKSMEKMEDAGVLSKMEQGGKTLWKKND
jgi:hypothetical protein